MSTSSMSVAFFGLGALGGPVCDALLASPHRVGVYDPRDEAVAPRVAAGARRASSAADAAADADVIIVFVRDDAQAIDVLTSAQGALASAKPNAVVVVHSTVAPATVRTLAAACRAANVRFIDAGVTGGGGRQPNRLYIMCGGDADTIDAVRPVLEVYSTDVVRFGDVGAGMNAKLIRNAIRYAMWAAQYEGFALAEAAGLDLGALAHVYRATFGTSIDDEVILSRATMAPTSADDVHVDNATFARMAAATTLGWKDLDDAYELAHEVGSEIPLARATRDVLGPTFGVAVYDQATGRP